MTSGASGHETGLTAALLLSAGLAALTVAAPTPVIAQGMLDRIWDNLVVRPSGPFGFRFFLQPGTAIIAAIHDGVRDAQMSRSPYFWTVLTNPAERASRLREGLKATSRILVLGLVMDAAYQLIVFKTFYPLEAIIVALLLAFVPYLLLRGPVARVARWWGTRSPLGRTE
jgi:hypothetical protein